MVVIFNACSVGLSVCEHVFVFINECLFRSSENFCYILFRIACCVMLNLNNCVCACLNTPAVRDFCTESKILISLSVRNLVLNCMLAIVTTHVCVYNTNIRRVLREEMSGLDGECEGVRQIQRECQRRCQ